MASTQRDAAPTRPCRKCRRPKPADTFVLFQDKKAKSLKWATRFWCGDCLAAGGHITRSRLDAAVAEAAERAQTREATALDKKREHEVFNELVDLARSDEAFAAAVERAAVAVQRMRRPAPRARRARTGREQSPVAA